jgi:hypothetical protein
MRGVQQHTKSSVSAVDPSSGSGIQQQLWLSMPTNIAQSFADDLIREFDNRRSQLQLDMLRAQVHLFLPNFYRNTVIAWDDTINGK